MTFFVNKDYQQLGPFTEGQILDLIRKGDLVATDLCRRDGGEKWQQVGSALPFLFNEQHAAPRSLPSTDIPSTTHHSAAFPLPNHTTAATAETSEDRRRYRCGGRRSVAFILDSLIYSAIEMPLIAIVDWISPRTLPDNTFFLGLACAAPYAAFFLSSKFSATPGMMICGIKLTDINGKRLTLFHAFGRHFASFVSYFLLLGFLWAAGDRKRRTWHDMLCGTVVSRAPDPPNSAPAP